jgi:hypothetical protein
VHGAPTPLQTFLSDGSRAAQLCEVAARLLRARGLVGMSDTIGQEDEERRSTAGRSQARSHQWGREGSREVRDGSHVWGNGCRCSDLESAPSAAVDITHRPPELAC